MSTRDLDMKVVRQLAMALPDVQESSTHGHSSFKVRGQMLACPAIHKSAEPNSLVLKVGISERAVLTSANPDAFYTTDHYFGHPVVLVRLSQVDRHVLKSVLKIAWLQATTRKPPRPRKVANRRSGAK
jgi:hypothetical protein